MSNQDENIDLDSDGSDDYDFDVDVENVDVEDDDTGYDLSHSSKEKSPKKKQHHNDLEQRRRKDLGKSFTRLQALVKDDHPSDKNEQMQKEISDLAKLNAMMRQKVEALRKEGKLTDGSTSGAISSTPFPSSTKKRKKAI